MRGFVLFMVVVVLLLLLLTPLAYGEQVPEGGSSSEGVSPGAAGHGDTFLLTAEYLRGRPLFHDLPQDNEREHQQITSNILRRSAYVGRPDDHNIITNNHTLRHPTDSDQLTPALHTPKLSSASSPNTPTVPYSRSNTPTITYSRPNTPTPFRIANTPRFSSPGRSKSPHSLPTKIYHNRPSRPPRSRNNNIFVRSRQPLKTRKFPPPPRSRPASASGYPLSWRYSTFHTHPQTSRPGHKQVLSEVEEAVRLWGALEGRDNCRSRALCRVGGALGTQGGILSVQRGGHVLLFAAQSVLPLEWKSYLSRVADGALLGSDCREWKCGRGNVTFSSS
ncbi:putative histone-lysine N-methyltransferase 2D-like 1 [Homarus americanus]|uniref:Putative histone-lysine N-methyltransferase 2D-like 1 n=1 Tax=Homarus americanus TaxID=6706 RepID=A0A8J5N5B5_HOMAM|nr:putative histone-lysine N-methyltransferase 2D-like 1 [Homarus americanus]